MVRQAGPQSVAAVCWISVMRRRRPPSRSPCSAGKRAAKEGDGAAGSAGRPAAAASPVSLGSSAMAAAPEEGLQAGDQGHQDLLRAHLDLGGAVHAVVEAVGAALGVEGWQR